MIACEVVAKIGDSIIEIARIDAGGTYSSPLVPFPLVCGELTGVVVHRPIGVAGWNRGVPIEATKVRVGPSDSIVLALGRVTLYVLPIAGSTDRVPRKRAELRPFAYGAAVLVLHLVVWGLAEANHAPPIEKLPAPLPTYRVQVAHVPVEEPPPPPPTRVADPPARPGGSPTKGRAKRSGRATSGESATLGAFGDLSMLIPSVDVTALVNDAEAYDEQAAEEARWGGSSGRFDPFRDCTTNCGTIASGPYETLSFQNRPRPRPRIVIASDDLKVKASMLAAQSSLVACYLDRALDDDTGAVHAELEAGPNGAYVLLYSRGLDTVGPCVATVIDALHLKGPANARASITIAFTFQ